MHPTASAALPGPGPTPNRRPGLLRRRVARAVGVALLGMVVVAPTALATPSVTDIDPAKGGSGTYVNVDGQDLDGVTRATITTADGRVQTLQVDGYPLFARFKMPPNPAGPVKVQLYVGATPVPSPVTFTYDGTTEKPFPSGLIPGYGLVTGGDTVHLYGERLDGISAVTFGGVAATNVREVDDTEATFTVPAHAAGRVDVTVTAATGTVTLPGGYLYVTPQAPTITVVSPNRGLAGFGGFVQLKGTNLGTVTKFLIGSKAATILSKSATSILAWAPPQAKGSYDTVVDGPNGPNLPSPAGGYTYFPPFQFA
ncbi:MAG: IPT/TIG domain-containing protein [Solirubrobacteraceae bacterium]|nr:IPT/TIG domain-containing protein [Patulibacter sp.]